MITIENTIANMLNDLIEINNDRIEGYEKATDETDELDLKSLFTEMAARSREFREELSEEVIYQDEKPTGNTTTAGKAFRKWMDLKTALLGKDRQAILSSCETGEDAALKTYRIVLESDVRFPDDVYEMIEKQFIKLRQDHNRIRMLRDTENVQA